MQVIKGVVIAGIVVWALSVQGCASTGLKKAIGAGNPLPQWEKELVAYYTATVPQSREAGAPPKLKFIHDYEQMFPQLSGIPYSQVNKKLAAFPCLTVEEYAAYRRDRLVSELRGKQDAIDVENHTLRLASLDAELGVLETQRKLLETGGKTDTEEYRDLKKCIAKAKTEISDAYGAIKVARKSAIEYEIERLGTLSAANHYLIAAGILEMAKHERNRILGDLMVVARRVHDMKDNYLHYTRASINTMFDFTQIIATGIGSVAGSESTARSLAALATGSAAAQESFDARFFYQHATAAVISTMKKQRHEAEQVLVSNMTKDVIEYPLRVALADYAAFLLAGGLTDALSELGADAKNKELRELEKLNDLKKMSESRLEDLKKKEEAKAAEQAARKQRQSEYINLVDKALFGRIDAVIAELDGAATSEGEAEPN